MSYGNGICAVVVTYNRKDLLPRCLKALEAQSTAPGLTIIVDNASTDGTPRLLNDLGYIDNLPPMEEQIDIALVRGEYIPVDDALDFDLFQPSSTSENSGTILYIRMASNTGGAGGFYKGQELAHKLGYDWIWLMDDDGYPSERCLEQLLDSSNKHGLLAVNPLVINCDADSDLSFGLSPSILNVNQAYEQGGESGIIYGLANPFNGTLLARELIGNVGYIKKEMFIWGDETEYFLRLAKMNYEFATLVRAKFYHPSSKTIYKSALWGALTIAGKPEKLEMNYYRNLAFLVRNYFLKGAAVNIAKSIGYYIIKRDLRKVRQICSYVVDGWKDKYKLKNIQD